VFFFRGRLACPVFPREFTSPGKSVSIASPWWGYFIFVTPCGQFTSPDEIVFLLSPDWFASRGQFISLAPLDRFDSLVPPAQFVFRRLCVVPDDSAGGGNEAGIFNRHGAWVKPPIAARAAV
jgi:hypothetical protein